MPIKCTITSQMLKQIEKGAEAHLAGAMPEHGWDHAIEVRNLAIACLPKEGDPTLCAAIALLHDADDYKQFPDPGGDVPNAIRILREAGVEEKAVQLIRSELLKFGYSKRLKGLSPKTPEGMAASDADMLTIMGASGIIRIAKYDAVTNIPFFDPEEWPNPDLNYDTYTACRAESAVRHMFDKILRLPLLMLTEKGRTEGYLRQGTCIRFLQDLFREQGARDWEKYLEGFLSGSMLPPGIHAAKEG